MSKARLVITAVIVEKRPVGEVARSYGVARSWVYALLARYRAEGEAAIRAAVAAAEDLTHRDRRGHRRADHQAAEGTGRAGLDAGPHTIAWHLEHQHQIRVSAATVSWYLTRHGLVTPEPRKRPKSSYIRFAAEQPNERWQSDFIHHHLAGGTEVEVVSWIDDHSRLALSVTAHPVTTGQVTLATFRAACQQHGVPASVLTDNGLVYTTRFAGGKGGRNGLENELRRLGVTQKNGRPSHPQTQGKAERFQQTLQKWLTARPPAADLAGLQAQLDEFTACCNTQRPHRSLPGRCTPAVACTARPKAVPGDRTADTHDRVRTDIIGTTGTVTLRHAGKLYHIGAGRAHTGTHVLLLVQDLHIRIINAATGELLRELTLDPARNYQPLGRPPGPKPGTPRKRKNPEP
jgi:transposase InsO family protein